MENERRPAGTVNLYLVGFVTVVVGVALIVTGLRDVSLERRVQQLERTVESITAPKPPPLPKTGRVEVRHPGDEPS